MGRPVELLVPAGSPEVLRIAVLYGADAVYIGGEAFSLRAKAKNFSTEEMEAGIRFAHDHGVKVYVTANIFAHNADLKEAGDYFEELEGLRPDAVIISDPGMVSLFREKCPGIDLHISTQANNTNYLTFRFWHGQGAKRVVSARELSLSELKEIRENIPGDMEIETFVHGSMCIAYSGRCLMSSFLTSRSANRGECTHPCRWKYSVVEETRPSEYMPVFENERGTFIFNSRDLCMIEHIPELMEAGIDSFKIEGRMKTALYVAVTARTYRKAIDDYLTSPALYKENMGWYVDEISKCACRSYTTGFFFGKPDARSFEDGTYISGYVFLGVVSEKDGKRAVIEQKNRFFKGDRIEIMKPDGRNIEARVLSITDEEGNLMESAPHPKQKLFLELDRDCEVFDILRMSKRQEELSGTGSGREK
ncbi:MAG TPA: peptidase U32 [Lachnospiraceae bacterium]|nr:peptidase U32 [Lachnospiraceae bacterium]